MGFATLLGNQRIQDNLRASLARGRVSHFYLLSGPASSGKHTLARLLAAGILCQGESRPCSSCPACRKMLAQSHPDFITIDDTEHKFVSIEVVRDAIADLYIRPNEGSHKIYLFPRAQDMLPPAQNALLKALEEPPAYGVFILLTDNPEALLPTIRSRCVELSLTALDDATMKNALQRRFPNADAESLAAAMARSGGFLGQAISLLEEGAALPPQVEAFARAYATKDAYGLLQVLVPMEKYKRDQLLELLGYWKSLLSQALLYRSGMGAASPLAKQVGSARSSEALVAAIDHLQQMMEYAQGNVSPAAICGYLEWALR